MKTHSLQLYEMPHSPFCIPISQALAALGIEFERVPVPNWDRSRVIQITNGAHYEVPVLVHDGRPVFESGPNTQDIARYVDGVFGGGRLFPPEFDGLQEILLDHIENDIESVTFKLVDPDYLQSIPEAVHRVQVIRHKERKFGRGCVDAWRSDKDAIRRQADLFLSRFERMLGGRDFLLGAQPVYLDFALSGILGNLTYNNWNRLSADQRLLESWAGRLASFQFH